METDSGVQRAHRVKSHNTSSEVELMETLFPHPNTALLRSHNTSSEVELMETG